MTDKEERILITKVSPHCHALRFLCDPIDIEESMFCDKNGRYVRITPKDCAKCKNPVLYGISRADALERMAKILCQWDTETNDCTECCNEKNKNACRCLLTDEGYIARAEAALDALLGGKK